MIAGGFDGRYFAKKPVGSTGDDETAEEIQVVEIGCADGDGTTDGAYEADDVDEDSGNVGCVAAPVEAEPEVIRAVGLSRVQASDVEVAVADEIVV